MRLLRSVVLATATTAAVLVPTAAQAGGYSHRDAAHDVVRFDDIESSAAPTPDPSRTSGDITSLAAYNSSQRVVVVIGLTEVSPNANDLTGLSVAVRTNRKVRRDINLIAITGLTRGYRTVVTDRRGRTVRCDAATAVDTLSRSATVIVPRSCFGRERWVQVGAGFLSAKGKTLWADDALINGKVSQKDLAFTPRVMRD